MEKAISSLGLKEVAALTGRSYQAVQQWMRRGRLPRTEYSGETHYAAQIAAACRQGDPQSTITRESLLGLAAVSRHDVVTTVTESHNRRAGEAAA